MRVFDASSESVFERLCDDLAVKVSEGMGAPDIIIGIRTGGERVALSLARHFPQSRCCFVTARRPSTKGKEKSGVRRILRYLPVRLLDLMRIMEARFLSRHVNPHREVIADISPEIIDAISHGDTSVLIVDDAVDSGYTLKAVTGKVTGLAGGRVSTAAITSTTCEPVIMPDFVVFNDKVLVRFPWSMDARQ